MLQFAVIVLLCVGLSFAGLPGAQAQDKPGSSSQEAGPPATPAPKLAVPAVPKAKTAAGTQPVDPNAGKTVEEIIARVNNEIITLTEYEKARQTAEEDARQECQGRCTPQQLQTNIEDRRKNTLRDLIDQSLLVQRGKDMGISVKAEVIKQLDQIRKQNKLESIDALEKAVTSEGMNWEDFQSKIENELLTRRVMSSEVGSHININDSDIAKYYEE